MRRIKAILLLVGEAILVIFVLLILGGMFMIGYICSKAL